MVECGLLMKGEFGRGRAGLVGVGGVGWGGGFCALTWVCCGVVVGLCRAVGVSGGW